MTARPTPWRALGLVLAAGLAAHVTLAAIADPAQFDVQSFRITAAALRDDPLQVYDTMRWPYPPAFFPWLLFASSSASELIPFDQLFRTPMIVADAAIALIVQDYLGRRGAGDNARVTAAASVMLGPVFLAISGYAGQLDSVAILPAVAAVWLWDRARPGRALSAGCLIGLGAAFKTVPIFVLLALIPWARSRREILALLVPAIAIPVLALIPFLVANGADTVAALRLNRGFPGLGGPSILLMNPGLVDFWQSTLGIDSVDLAIKLSDVQNLIVGAGIVACGIALWRHRVGPPLGASLIWLVVFAINPNFAWQYLVWGIPFFLMAGFLRETVFLQLIALPALVLFYVPGDLSPPLLDFAYTPLALAVWLLLVAAAFLVARAVLKGGASPDATAGHGPGRVGALKTPSRAA